MEKNSGLPTWLKGGLYSTAGAVFLYIMSLVFYVFGFYYLERLIYYLFDLLYNPLKDLLTNFGVYNIGGVFPDIILLIICIMTIFFIGSFVRLLSDWINPIYRVIIITVILVLIISVSIWSNYSTDIKLFIKNGRDCNKNPDGTFGGERANLCYMGFDKAVKDITVCNKTTNSIDKEFCIYYVARINIDASLCEELDNQTLKENCLGYVKRAANYYRR